MATNMEDPQTAGIALTDAENPPLIESDSDDGILSSYSLPNFADLTESSREQQSSLTRSQYAMVVFHGVAETYPTDSDIVCRYSLTDGVEAVPGDRVVLFAVGWTSIKDYIVFEWAPIPEKGERDLTVVFKAADLPKDVNEFYQVCYVSNESAVCGASVPFQVRTPNNEELTFALEEDMVVVRSSTAVAQDKLLKVQLDIENLNKKKLLLEKKLRSMEGERSLTLERLDKLQEENVHLLGVNERMLNVQKHLEETQIKLDNVVKEKLTMQEECEASIRLIEDRNQHLEELVKNLQDELMGATENIKTLQCEREKFQNELAIANRNLEQCEQTKSSLATKNFALDNELTVCKFNLNNAQLETLRLEAEFEELEKENKKLSQELNNAQKSENMRESFYTEYSSTDRGRLIMNNQRLQTTTEDMQLKISTLEHEKSTLEQVLADTLDAQKNNCSDHCNLEKRIAQLQYRLDEVSNDGRTTEKIQSGSSSSSSIDQSLSLANQVENLTRLLEDSLKENEAGLQENLALRVQIEILETGILKEKSKAEEYVIVSPCDNSHTAQPYEVKAIAENYEKTISKCHAEIQNLRELFGTQKKMTDEYAGQLTDKDEKIHNLSTEIESLGMKFLEAERELKLEVSNLVSKNAALVEQEAQSRKLKDEMQRITFMNEELLVQNSSLMERVHNDNSKSITNTDSNMLQKSTDSENPESFYSRMEKEYLKILVKSLREQLDETRRKVKSEKNLVEEWKETSEILHKETTKLMEMQNKVKIKEVKMNERIDMLFEKMAQIVTKKCSHECRADSKMEEIGQNVASMLSTMKNNAHSSRVKRDDGNSASLEVDDLKHRLELARGEYEKLHTVMGYYRTKYNELKAKCIGKFGKSHHFSN